MSHRGFWIQIVRIERVLHLRQLVAAGFSDCFPELREAGGFLLIPVLLLLYRAAPKPAAPPGFVVLNSLAGISGHLWRGHMDWTMTMSLLTVVVFGGFLGSRLGSTYWDTKTVQKVISIVLLLGGGKLLFDFTRLVF